VQRKRSLVLHSFTVRDHTGGIKAESSFTKGEPELYVHERLVEPHGGRCVGVIGTIQNGRGLVFHHGLELGKTAQEGSLPGEGAGEVCQAALESTGEEEELRLSSQGRWEVLQFVDDCNGLVSTNLQVWGNEIIGMHRGAGRQRLGQGHQNRSSTQLVPCVQ
jgi:hypothetical protein